MNARSAVGLGTLLVPLLALGPARPAVAVPIGLQRQIAELEQRASNLSLRFQPQAESPVKRPETRLVDARVLYTLEDYSRAAIILLDYVERYQDTPGYPEALYYLGDSLFHQRDFLGAHRYFRKIADEVKGPYYQDALLRLIEISLETGEQAQVKSDLDALQRVPAGMLKPNVPYVLGKYHYFMGDVEAALAAFRRISPGQPQYTQGQYFVGTCLVRKNDQEDALKAFQALLNVEPRDDEQKRIRQLTYLAIGRLLYQKGEVVHAIDSYRKVDRNSDSFDAALYETAWAHIKAEEYEAALRALDLLTLAQPESPLAPDVRVLEGNLLIRLQRWGRATDLFSDTRQKFEPVNKKMDELMARHSDPNVFFDALLERGGSSRALAMKAEVPHMALDWVKESPDVKRALDLVEDARAIQKDLEEADKLLRRLEMAVNSPAKIKVFPGYAEARTRATELENRLTQASAEILQRERELISPRLGPAEQEQLEALAAGRAELEHRIKNLPPDSAALRRRSSLRVTQVEALEKQISRLEVVMQSLRAGLVAAEKHFADTAQAREEAARESFHSEAEQQRVMVDTLTGEVEALKLELAQARDSFGIGGPDEVAERSLKDQFRMAVNKEHAFLLAFRARLRQPEGTEFDQLANLMSRADGVDNTLQVFGSKLEKSVENELADVRVTIARERTRIGEKKAANEAFRVEADQVAGSITHDGFRAVARRFYDIVVRADVGIIDVSWALKEAKTKQLSGLVRQRKLDLKLLDDEFKEVLAED